ncbi:MAG TPA: hypothetical protein VF666_11150 [Pyrinomonadaceae bacterium]|jgi:hypothetical protein
MTTDNIVNPLTARFVGEGSKVLLELTNASEQTLRHIEVLTVFLKDEETPGGGPSQVNIKFKDTECLYPKEKVVLTHRTWINGKPSDSDSDQLQRLQAIAGEVKPYVLDISWEDANGKSRYQRIPVGH